MDTIISLFSYFSAYVPKSVLSELFRLPDMAREPGYDEFATEVLRTPDNKVIPAINTFVCSANRKYVSDKIKNSNGIVLFVEYGAVLFNPGVTDGVKQKLAITVCREYNVANNDNLNETLLMNECNNILSGILQQMQVDQENEDVCGLNNLIVFPADILPIDSDEFFDRSGWTALFDNQNTIV